MSRNVGVFSKQRPRSIGWGGARTALALLGIVLCLVASIDLLLPAAAAGQADFPEPTELRAVDGVLRATLTAEEQEIEIAGQSILARVFNGTFVGPTLRVRPGERIELELVNRLNEPTNLHFHGLHVSPGGEADNIFRTVNPGDSAHYVLDIPLDHPTGTFWYHPHMHHLALEQVFGGMSGVIIIDGIRERLPPDLQGIDERLFALKDFQLDENNAILLEDIPRNPTTRTINGQIDPALKMAPGETQLWRLANVGAEVFYNLRLYGHAFHVVAEDGNPVWDVRTADSLVLPPGKRFDVLVQAGEAGVYAFETITYDQGNHVYPEVELATLTIEGSAQSPVSLPASVAPDRDLDSAEIATTRDIFFNDVDDEPIFEVNGQQFDPNRIDELVQLGTVEEWTIRNVTAEQHPFHIHVDDFQVVSVNGQPYNAANLQDIVILPAGGEVVIRIPFMDYPGKFVFHCHILFHEDHGMMALVDVVE
ncbi:MAG: mco 1 [Thermomicrobiales bacterium]|nr:mco 1 [Thermomicrobiales bacterium]